jgi:hypothetical protein
MCCGRQRALARQAVTSAVSASPVGFDGAESVSDLVFEYTGPGEAAIKGPVTGRIYRFARTGDRRRVDARDRPGLAATAWLRWIR